MSSFTNFDPATSVVKNAYASKFFNWDYRVVTKSFSYDIGFKGSNQQVIIPQGFLTDGASIPKALSKYIPPWGKYGAAAIVHDYLCETLQIVDQGQPRLITRKKADKIFFEAMGVLEVPLIVRVCFYLAVRSWVIYNKANKPIVSYKKRTIENKLTEYYYIHGNYDYKDEL